MPRRKKAAPTPLSGELHGMVTKADGTEVYLSDPEYAIPGELDYPPRTSTEIIDAQFRALDKRVRHLEGLVYRLVNGAPPEGSDDDF